MWTSLGVAILLHLALLVLFWNWDEGGVARRRGLVEIHLHGGRVPGRPSARSSPEEKGGIAEPLVGEGEGSLALSELVGAGNTAPEYPPEALIRGWEGRVILRIRRQEGASPEVEVVESSGHPLLDESAVAKAKTWHIDNSFPKVFKVPIQYRIQ